jgi:predicted acylesterase/phospholipase RssA
MIHNALEWVDLDRGALLFEPGATSDGLYIVVSGLLQAFIVEQGVETPCGAIGAHEVIGETSVLLGQARSAGIRAFRPSTLGRISESDAQQIYTAHPDVAIALLRNALQRLESANKQTRHTSPESTFAVLSHGGWAGSADSIQALVTELTKHGPTLYVNAQTLGDMKVLVGASALPATHPGWFGFEVWLEEQRLQYETIILECDPTTTSWTRQALRAADHAILFADASTTPEESALQTAADDGAPGGLGRPTTLVLVHPQQTQQPSGTRRWLNALAPMRHLHIRVGVQSDVERVSRIISGRGIGLVLGGGGARGFARLGVIRALREAGVPIDMVGGTSMGGIIGAQLGLDLTCTELVDLNWRGVHMKPFSDYTIPIMALMRSVRAERLAEMMFGDVDIEDLWLPYFAVSVDLVTGHAVVHKRGPARTAIRATSALPGVLVPVFDQGRVLVDGGLLNNLPVDVMSEEGAAVIVGVNVSPERDLPTAFEGLPTVSGMMLRRLGQATGRYTDVPTIGEILARSMTLGNAKMMQEKRDRVDLMLDPPVAEVGMLEFDKLDELVEAGHAHAQERLDGWTVASSLG